MTIRLTQLERNVNRGKTHKDIFVSDLVQQLRQVANLESL